MNARSLWALLVAGGLAAAGCNAILGISEHPVATADTDATTGKDAGSGSGSSSGTGSSSGSGSGSDAGSGSGSGTGSSTGSGSGSSECPGGPDSGPPSCATPGPGTGCCGTTGDSCCTTLGVDGGTFSRTYTNTGTGPTGEADPATISTVNLDKYLVTVGRFRRFVAAVNQSYFPPARSGKHTYLNSGNGLANNSTPATPVYEPGWVAADDVNIAPTNENLAVCAPEPTPTPTWTPAVGDHENLPVNCVNWYEAYAFCIWDGGFLASEAEWEYAAAGGSQQREYPWGSAAPGSANAYAIYGDFYPGRMIDAGTPRLAPVGSAPMGAGVWGQLDLAGNVWEWVLDWVDRPYVDPCVNCAFVPSSPPNLGTDAGAAPARAFRGGSAYDIIKTLEPTWRGWNTPTDRRSGVGFRCARAP